MVLAFVPSMVPMVFLRAMSGFFMASLRPVCNGLVAATRHHLSRMSRGCVRTVFRDNILVLFSCTLPGK